VSTVTEHEEELWALLRCMEKAGPLKMTIKRTMVASEPLAVCGMMARPVGTSTTVSQYQHIARFRTAAELEAWLDGIAFSRG